MPRAHLGLELDLGRSHLRRGGRGPSLVVGARRVGHPCRLRPALVRPDKLITRYVLAPRAATQVEMNALYAQDADFYLPFRYQVPLLLPYAAIFMLASYRIDRYNLLRVPTAYYAVLAVLALFIMASRALLARLELRTAHCSWCTMGTVCRPPCVLPGCARAPSPRASRPRWSSTRGQACTSATMAPT